MPRQTYTGAGSRTFTLPSRVNHISMKAWGAGSGTRSGSYAEGEIDLDPGESVDIIVGGAPSGTNGGYPNGGDGKVAGNQYSLQAISEGGAGGTSIEYAGQILLVAGGAGGEAAAKAQDDSSGAKSVGASGDGGDGDRDAPEVEEADSFGGDGPYLAGGVAGAQTGQAGEDGKGGHAEDDGLDSEVSAATGGGGGGYNGGGTGNYELSSNDSTATGGGGGTSYTDDSLFSDYVNWGGGNTGDGEVRILYPPKIPEAPSVTLNPPGFNITWPDSNSGETEYRIHKKGPQDSNFSQIASVGGNTTSYTDTNVEPAKTYEYTVSAYDGDYSMLSDKSTSTSATYVSGPKAFDGSSFTKKQVYVYDGSTWVPKQAHVYDGDAFQPF